MAVMQHGGNNDKTLEQLMCLAQKGDKQAYACLFREITPLIRSFVGKKLNNREDVEEVVQEILMSVHKASHTYDTGRPFRAWMYTIVRYRLADHLRSVYTKLENGKDVPLDDVAYVLPDHEDVTESYENREYLIKMLNPLPDKQRKIVTMMKIEGYSARETAEAMHMSESAVKASAHRAFKALRKKVTEDGR